MTTTSPEHIIIDCDPGIDDTLALFLTLASPQQLQLDAITIVMGNHNNVDLLAKNASLILEMAHLQQQHNIPVIKGANKPLIGPFMGEAGIEVHAPNGLGNVPHPITQFNNNPVALHASMHAASFLIEHCAANPGQVSIVAIGPLTNVALACLLGGELFIKSVKRLLIMGGDVSNHGNVSPVAEANIMNDPEAARIVFESFPDITMAGLNCTHQVLMDDEFRQRMRQCSAVGEFCFNITQHYHDLLSGWNSNIVMHDPTIILYMLAPDQFETIKVCVDVETEGRLTRGQTVADWRRHWKGRVAQTTVLMKVKSLQALHDLFIERLSTLKWKPPHKLEEKLDAKLGEVLQAH